MAVILDLTEYKTIAGLTTTDAARDAALALILNEVNEAVTRLLRQPLDSTTYTEYLNAPPTPRIALRYWPVTSVTSVRIAYYSGGDPSKFTSDTAWDQYTGWVLESDPDGTSRSGVLRAVRGGWSYQITRPIGRLAYRIDPNWRAVQVVYVAGYDQIPASLKAAAQLITSRLAFMRKLGVMPTSASLNGASYSLQTIGGSSADVLLGDPTIVGFLKPFSDIFVGAR